MKKTKIAEPTVRECFIAAQASQNAERHSSADATESDKSRQFDIAINQRALIPGGANQSCQVKEDVDISQRARQPTRRIMGTGGKVCGVIQWLLK
jgi:hypothetical protein